jgi:predicted permease
MRAGLVVAEIAAAVILLVGAGLLVRTFVELRRVDVGFDTSNLLVLRITPDAARYRTNAQTNDYYRRVLTSLREVPAIQSVAAVTTLPMSTIGSEFTRPYWREGARPEGNAVPEASIRMATPGYFATLRLPVIAGREFTDRDDAEAPRVVIINQRLAANAWGSENPVGRHLVLDYQQGPYPYEVVGVVGDDRHKGPRSEPVPEIFIPHAQNPYLVLNVVARTTLDPMAVARTARATALTVDPDQPVHSVTTMDQLLGDAVQLDRFAMLLITLFAAGGLITAAGGVYALLAYTVVQRRREIALRMALGASPQRVARSIVMESLVLAAAGGTIGLLGALAGSRLARTLLFGVTPQDPVTLVTAVVVLLVVVLSASWLPARRAALIDPSRAMRI